MLVRRSLCHILMYLLLSANTAVAKEAVEQASEDKPGKAPSVEIIEDEVEQSTGILSFKTWKSEKVQEAIAEIVRLRRQAAIEAQKPEKDQVSKEPSAGLRAHLDQAKINLDVVRELSVTDYFALYLARQKNRAEAFMAAAKMLDDNEVAELLTAYDNSMRDGGNREPLRLGLGDGPSAEAVN